MAKVVDKNMKALFEADFKEEYGYDAVLERLGNIMGAVDESELDNEDWDLLAKYDNRARAQKLAAEAGKVDKEWASSLPDDNPAKTITDQGRLGGKKRLENAKRAILEGEEKAPTFSPVTFSPVAVEYTLNQLRGNAREPGALVENSSNQGEALKRAKRAREMLDKGTPVERGPNGDYRVGSSNGGMYEIVEGQCNCPDNGAPTITLKDGSQVKGCKHAILWLAIMQARNEKVIGGSPVATREAEVNVKEVVSRVVDGLVQEAEKVVEKAAPKRERMYTWNEATAIGYNLTYEEGQVLMLWRPESRQREDRRNWAESDRRFITREEYPELAKKASAAGYITQCIAP